MQTEIQERKRVDMSIVDILRRVTVTVKTFPFFYAFGLLLFWLISPILTETSLNLIDGIIYLSAIMIILLIRLSYCVKLCIWHRLQCALPLLPQIVAQVDRYILKFDLYLAIVEVIVMCIIFTLSLINAYFVFIKPTTRNKRSLNSSALNPLR